MNLLKPFSRLMRYGRSIRCLLAGSPALYILLKNSFFVKCGIEKLVIYIVKTKSFYSIGKSFAGDSFITEKKNCLLHYRNDFFFTGQDSGKRETMGYFLSPTSADIHLEAWNIFLCNSKRTLSSTSGTVVAFIWIHTEFSIHHLCNLNRAALLHLADSAALTLGKIEDRDILSYDSKVVEVRLDTVVWAATHSNLELVGENYVMVAHIEELMELL